MTDPASTQSDDTSATSPSVTEDATTPKVTKPTPVRCFTGAFISAPFAYGLYLLTAAIAHTFAEKPIHNTSPLATKISVLVRTLVVGSGALATGIFAITTLGLVLLGIQLLIKGNETPSRSSKS